MPAEARRALRLSDGAYLDLQVTNGTASLKPVEIIERTDADRQLDAILSRMRYIGPEPRPTEDEFMDMVVEEIGPCVPGMIRAVLDSSVLVSAFLTPHVSRATPARAGAQPLPALSQTRSCGGGRDTADQG